MAANQAYLGSAAKKTRCQYYRKLNNPDITHDINLGDKNNQSCSRNSVKVMVEKYEVFTAVISDGPKNLNFNKEKLKKFNSRLFAYYIHSFNSCLQLFIEMSISSL